MLFITCALHCEAKSIVDKYKLKLDREAYYPVFSNNHIALIVTGIGQLQMASAISYVFSHCGEPENAVWLNLGIAGHSTFSIETLLNISKVTDAISGENYYPGRLINAPGQSSPILSVDKPGDFYPEAAAIDMEAAAFMQIVQRYTLNDMVQIVKVVSDNNTSDIAKIDKQLVTAIIQKNMLEIERLIALMLEKSQLFNEIYSDNSLYEEIVGTKHFTEYQRNELQRLTQRIKGLAINFDIAQLNDCLDAKSIIHFLTNIVDSASVEF